MWMRFDSINLACLFICVQDSQVSEALDPNVVMQLFAPLVASQRNMLDHIKNPYHTVRCCNGFTFVFEQVLFYYYYKYLYPPAASQISNN